eukprot:9218707-Karenia_brevis.AAC.1
MANAFPSPKHTVLDAKLESTFSPSDATMLKARHRLAVMEVASDAGDTVLLAPRCGNLQGDIIAPSQFEEIYDQE